MSSEQFETLIALLFVLRWLDEGEDDGKIVRELSLHDDQSDEKYKQELVGILIVCNV